MTNLMKQLLVYGDLLKGIEYDVVTIHPLADETELLEKLNIAASLITQCDLYWVYNNRFIFVSIGLPYNNTIRTNYYRRFDAEAGDTFSVNTAQVPLTKASVNRCLRYLAEWIEAHSNVFIEADKEALNYQRISTENDESPNHSDIIMVSNCDIAVET